MTDTARPKPPNAGKGRPKGVPNKNNAAVKEMVLTALDMAGGADYLHRQSAENPTAFMTLIGKIMPTQVNAELDVGKRLSKVIREIVRAPHSNG